MPFFIRSKSVSKPQHLAQVNNTQNNTQTTQNNMPPSKLIVWICGDCSTRNDSSEPGPCVLCDAPHPKRNAIVVDWSVPAASAAVASSAPAKFAPKCGPVGATPPSGLVLDIVGIAVSSNDWSATNKA